MSDRYVVSTSPHIRAPLDTAAAMRLVCLALLPAIVASAYFFGPAAMLVILVSVSTCVLTEMFSNKIFGKANTIGDCSAVVTGILLAFTLPPTTPLWLVAIGGFFAIFIAKQLFGGLGFNIFNPALAARAVLHVARTADMVAWKAPVKSFTAPLDAITSATPLAKEAPVSASYMDLFLGNVPGSLGETCKVALLIGAVLLLAYKVIDWRIPLGYIGTVALLALVKGRDPLFEVLAGGLILGAFFMATDLVTSPATRLGRLIFGIGCGVLVVLIRGYSNNPEGVCYSILIMNCFAPLIDKCAQPRVFGTKRAWSLAKSKV